MNTVIVLRGYAATLTAAPNRVLRDRTASIERVRLRQKPRPTVVAAWLASPVDGKLECHWTADASASRDEGRGCSGSMLRSRGAVSSLIASEKTPLRSVRSQRHARSHFPHCLGA